MKFLKFLACILILCVGFVAGFVGNYFYSTPESEKFIAGGISFHFLELGNEYCGDSVFIQCGEYDILIDAGSRSSSASAITSYVDQYVTDGKLEYVIATHADQDHISAFYSTSSSTGVLDYYDVDMIIDFPLSNKDTKVIKNYREARDAKVASGTKHYTALECYNNENGAQRVYELSNNVTMEILYNYYYENTSSSENNYSVCLMFHRGEEHYLFTGDLEKEGEAKLVEYYKNSGNSLPQCKLYKAGHHGSKTSSSKALMEAIKPEIVVVCTVAGSDEYTDVNENKFPTQIFIDNVAPYTSKVYVTSSIDGFVQNGNIRLSFNGSKYEEEFSKSDKVLKDSDWFKQYRTCPDAWKTA